MITDKQVEIVAKAIHRTRMKRAGCNSKSYTSLGKMWEQLPYMWKSFYLEDAKAVLMTYESTAWQPIETAPNDKPIMRWHVNWECPVVVYLNVNVENALQWIEQTKTTSWPETAFSPYWRPLPQPPGGEG